MIAINDNGKIKTFATIPKKWKRVHAYNSFASDIHFEDGFREVVTPQVTEGKKLGAIQYDEANDVFTYPVLDKTPEELKAEKISESQVKKSELLKEIQENKVIEEMQAVTDETKLLEVADLFPIWEEGMELAADEKVQGFLGGELVLFKVIQAHTTQEDWQPENTPALFVRVGYEGEILDWVQPTGAHDAYNIGDKVKFNGSTYESLINANTYSPTAYPQGWKIV